MLLLAVVYVKDIRDNEARLLMSDIAKTGVMRYITRVSGVGD